MSPSQLDKRAPQSPETLEQTMSVGYGVIGAFIVFGVVGYLLDRWLNTAPWLFVLSVVVGAAIALYGVSRLLKDQTHPQ